MTPCIVVVARVAPRDPDAPRGARRRVELFLPYDQVNRGNIAIWDGCHGEASLGYRETKAPRKPEHVAEAAEMVQRYRNFMASIPAEDRQEIVERQRLPNNWRDNAWS
jgi:hypothetical protein